MSFRYSIAICLIVCLSSLTIHGQNNKESIVYLNGGGYIGSNNNIGAYMGLEFDWSFVQLGGDTDINPWLTNFYGLSLGIGYRF